MRLAVLAVLLASTAACTDAATDDGDVTVSDDVGAPTETPDATATGLTAAQAKEALLQLDNICGDTWCDGDWIFSFKKITCTFSKGTCTSTILIYPSVADVKPLPTYWRSCKIAGLKKYSDLVTTTNGYSSINQDFYSKMTDCVFAIEAKLPPAP